MKQAPYLIAISIFATLFITPLASAKGIDPAKNTINDWTFGESLIGETVTKDSLKGKVVVIEYWGVQ